jgi:DNA-binding NarL/FixJ family response regulator
MLNPEPQARLLLVDDHALFRDSLARFLDGEPEFKVVGGCGTVEEARELLHTYPVDLVLLDFDLGQRDGMDFMRIADSLGYKGKVLLVTAGVDEASASEFVRRGVAGVFFKHNSPALLVDAIREVLSGQVWFEQGYLQKLVGRAASKEIESLHTRRFTEREQQVLTAVFEGLANKQIADRLQVSESSVKGTLQQLFEKTGVRTRSQLVRIALEQYRDLI